MENDNRPTHLDLFSGIGGFALAFGREGFRTIGHAEVEPFACEVYHHHFHSSVCFGGVQNVTRHSVIERCGELPVVVTGGFPCQPHSMAGKRLASRDERDLWGECKRVLGDLRPRFALFENVAGLLTSEGGRFLNRVVSDLAEIRFACLWQVVSAADVGAPHRRERVWLLCVNELADSNGGGCSHGQSEVVATKAGFNALGDASAGCDDGLADTSSNGRDKGHWIGKSGFAHEADALCEWPSRPGQLQHGWEPPRVVGDATQRKNIRRESGILGSSESGWRCVDDAANAASESSRMLAHNEQQQRDRRGDGAGRRERQSCETLQAIGRGGRQENGLSETKPALGGLPNGISAAMVRAWPEVHSRVGQLKGYGNAIVPQVAQVFARAIYNEITK